MTEQPIIKDIEDKYKVSLGVDPNTKVSDYVRSIGYPSLADMIDDIFVSSNA